MQPGTSIFLMTAILLWCTLGMFMEQLGEKCGIFGIFGKGLAASRLTFFGLFSLQHRGQESSGIAATDGQELRSYKNVGLVTHAYDEEDIERLVGHVAIGHNRYSTSAGTGITHAQPVVVHSKSGEPLLALAHNGNLPGVTKLVEFLKTKNITTDNLSDSELIAQVIGWHLNQGTNLRDAISAVYPLCIGAFSLLVMTKDTLVAVKDSSGIRPLCMGRLNGGFIFASETCALTTTGAEFIKELAPGEMVVVNDTGVESVQIVPGQLKFDMFEFVYFARHDSVLWGSSVYDVRKNFGEHLARAFPVDADIVVPVPETAVPVAVGYAQASGIPLEMALAKNRYIHRTFIQPDQHARDLGVKLKLVPLPNILKGKRVVLMDDSIVRGTTSKPLINAIFEAGAKEVHFYISSAPVKFPDFYGIDTPRQKDLLASHKSIEEMREFLGATSLRFLSIDDMVASTGLSREQFCLSCFTGEYPIDIGERWGDVSVVK